MSQLNTAIVPAEQILANIKNTNMCVEYKKVSFIHQKQISYKCNVSISNTFVKSYVVMIHNNNNNNNNTFI